MKIPEGWKLVPVEPTAEMLDARWKCCGDAFSPQERWEAMLAAAPTPPAQEDEDEPVYLVFSNSTCYDGSWEFANKDEFNKADEDDRYKLYTRRDNSELKKAAEEALVMLKEQEHTGSITALGEQVIRNLEIALGVSSKSFMEHLDDRKQK